MKNSIETIIYEAISDLNDELENENLDNPNLETRLFGGENSLDSLSFVSLITDIESAISEKFDISLVLASEKAMSQRVSPFRTVQTLVNYIEQELTSNNV